MAKKNMPFYNVSSSVGKGGVNNPEDVLLVQFFLTEVAKVGPHPMPPPKNSLPVNGMATSLLNDWIDWFQKAVKSNGKTIANDCKIDPARMYGNDIYNGNGTILHLNMSYRRRFRTAHNSLDDAPNCPAPLKAKFSQDLIG